MRKAKMAAMAAALALASCSPNGGVKNKSACKAHLQTGANSPVLHLTVGKWYWSSDGAIVLETVERGDIMALGCTVVLYETELEYCPACGKHTPTIEK